MSYCSPGMVTSTLVMPAGIVTIIRAFAPLPETEMPSSEEPPPLEEPLPEKDIIVTDAHPYRYNRVIPFSYFNHTGHTQYALGETAGREAVLLFNTHTELTEEKTIEYII